nr:immunoglobulin light chain junction region [Macaca mulatta]MOX53672.1 immunoglobulin light chain junction region [Macaca mulatta]MOX55286.1 immunoglobulin light chain junction region [Macaca mulatta]MOX57181.1 immunoglobulin light chain junction region [Macaca mulatta]MOX57608.1 immunoglobulin light chain junction region [Macaca mulatta]
CLQTKIFPWTF